VSSNSSPQEERKEGKEGGREGKREGGREGEREEKIMGGKGFVYEKGEG
jgi:hypothetical protein